MNRQLRQLMAALMVCYVALFIKLNQVQVFDAAELNNRPDNTRKIERDFNHPRGDIVSADGVLLAHSEPIEGRFAYQRTYPKGDLFAHTVGSYSFVFGSDGIEKTYNDDLAGVSDSFKISSFTDPFNKVPNVGTVVTTLREDVQTAARTALGENRGSVVALNPQTGALLAMWSNPSYDPNFVSTNDTIVARAFRGALDADVNKPRLARSFRERYFPGSTFKIVTAAAGLESGKITETAPDFARAKGYQPPLTNRAISNFGGSTCGGTLFEILRVSCNSAFAQMGAELLGPDPMVATAEKFGFNSTAPIDLAGAATSVFPTDFGKRLRDGANPGDAPVFENTPLLALASIGQGEVSATPLQMALVASAVANNGNIMTPHVMSEIRGRNGSSVEEFTQSVWRRPIGEATATTLRRAMLEVAADGTAKAMRIDGFEVGGKTGTAQLGTPTPSSHAWVIGFAGPPGQAPTVAIAVLVEAQPGASEQTGGAVAAPIAKQVLEVALGATTEGK
jgi:peptidoglycan glycosyltransferase